MFWVDDLFVLLMVVLFGTCFLLYQLFLRNQSTLTFWEKVAMQKELNQQAQRTFHSLDQKALLQQTLGNDPSAGDRTTFLLQEFSLPVCRSIWRIVEYVLRDFIDFWWVKISDSNDFGHDLRGVFDHAMNVIGERCIRVDWSPFIVKNVIKNLLYLMRIYRLTEQDLSSHNPFFSNTPETARHRLLKAELMRTYKLHVAVSNPQAYLRKLSTAVLSQILRGSDFRSETVRTLAREVLTSFVFLPVMSFVEPYWVNAALVTFLQIQQEQYEEEPEPPKRSRQPEPSKQPPSSSSSTRSSNHNNNVNDFSSVAYTQLNFTPPPSKPSSRNSSPTRMAFTMPTSASTSALGTATIEDETVFDTSTSSSTLQSNNNKSNGVTSTNTINDVSSTAATPLSTTPTGIRSESLLTHKMKEWDEERAKRNEKKLLSSRHQQAHSSLPPQHSSSSASSSSHHQSSDPSNRHDDDIPTGLLSPQGAFSHSPNHALSPVSSSNGAPHPSLLTTNWEVRIIGAGIRFDPKPFVMYQLLVTNGDYKWTVVKRYNKFEELHRSLKKAISSFDAQLPRKSFFNNLDQSFIQNRKIELQTYLGQLLWNKNVQQSADLQNFLMPTAEDFRWSQAPNGTGANGFSTPQMSQTPSAASSSSSSFSFFGSSKKNKHDNHHADDSRIPAPQIPIHPPHASSSHVYPQTYGAPPQNNANRTHTLPVNTSNHSPLVQNAGSDDEATMFQVDSPTHSANGVDSPPQRLQPKTSPLSSESLTVPTGASSSTHHAISPPSSPRHHYQQQPQMKQQPQQQQGQSRMYSADDMTPAMNNAPLPPQFQRTRTTGFPAGVPSMHPAPPSSASTNWDDQQLTAPLYHLVEEIFNLNGRGWMRRQATWVGKQLVRMTMDTLIKKKLTRQIDAILSESVITQQIDQITELIWPNGALFESRKIATDEEKEAEKAEALKLLKQSIPTALKTMIGSEHCVKSIEKCFQFMQMEPLIIHFAYSVLDSLILELFPNLAHVLNR